MSTGHIRQFAKLFHATKNGTRQPRMLLHNGPLPIVQFAGLVEDGVRNPELAQIMQQGRTIQQLHSLLLEPHGVADLASSFCNPHGVTKGEVRLGVHYFGKRLTDQVYVRRAQAAGLMG